MESSISNMSSLGTKVNKDSLPHRSEFAGQHRDSRPMLKQGMECCLVSADSLSALDVDIKYAKSITKEEKEYWKKHLPRGFQFCLKGLARSVIYHQPENITEFAAHYFENNLHLRNAELSKLPEHSYFSKLCHKPTSGIQQKAFGRPERNPSSSQATHTIAQEKHSIDPQSINLQHDSHSLTVKPFLSSLVGLEETHVIGIADDEAMDSAVEEKETQLPTSSQKQDMSALKQNSASSQMHTLVKKEDTIRICRKRFEPNVSELGSEKVQFPTLSENCIFKEERTLETSAQETLRHHWTSSFPSHELSDVRETSDIYISRSHTVCGALHETKYYQNGLTLQGKNSDTGSQQVVNSNISNKNAEGINDQADSCLWQPLMPCPNSPELMDARGDQLKCHLDLGAEDKGHFTNAKQEFEQGSVGAEDYSCKKNCCEINESRATGEDHVTPQRTSEEPSWNDCSCQEGDGVVRLPSPTNKTGQTDAEHRENETEEDSIGEDIQARFRAEQNTYFIPIKSDSQLIHAAWGPVQEDSAVATGQYHDSSVVAESSGIPCCCQCHTEFLLEETPGPSVENMKLDAVPLEEPQHITVLKSCSQENSAMCNSGEVIDKARSESYAEVTANYISELKKMAENIEHILDEQNLRGLEYMATTGYDENNCSSRQSEQFITVDEEEKSRNSAHEMSNKYVSHDKQLYTSITCGDSNKLNILFSSLYHKVSTLSYLETGATANTNNSGNSSSSNPVTIRDRETRPSPKVAREGVIIYEKDPNPKKTQADLVIFEGNHVISIPKEAIMANTWRDYYTPPNINSSETETMSSNYSVSQTSINDQDLGGKNAKEAMQQSPRYFVPQQCSTTASKSVNVQNLSSRTRKISECKARRYVPITRVCARLGKLSGTSINNDNEQPASPKTRRLSPKSPTYIKTSPKTRSPSPRLPKSKSPKLSKSKTLSPKSPKSKAISPKSKSKNYGSKFNHKNFSPKSRNSSPKSQNSSSKLSLSRAVSLKSRSSSSSRSSRPKTRIPKPFREKSRSSSPKSSISRSFSPKFKKIRSPSLKSPKTRASSKLKVSNSQEKVLRKSSPGQHDHIGAQYILQPPGITFKGKKTKSWTDVNKLPTKKSPVSTESKKMKKPQGKASAKKKIKPDNTFPLSLHTYHDPLALSSYVPDMTRQLTIESPKENLMIHTTYIRPNPLHLNSKGIFELISQKRRLYLEDKEKVLSSDETRQLICETECFVRKDPKTKRLVITNGTLNELVQKTVTRSTTKLNANGRSMSKSKSETNNVQQPTNLKATKLPFQHVEMIGDYVYIGNHKPKSLSQVKDADGNENSNAHGCDNLLCCSSIVDQLETNNGYICQRNCFNTGFVSYIQTDSLPDNSVTNFSEFITVLKMISDPVNLHFDLLSNRNNNSADGTSEMEDATLGDVDQIITEHPQLSSVKQRQGRRSRPNSPSKRSLKGKCPECEPNMPGDAEDKHFLDFEHQVHPNEINESNEVQTGSSLELRTSLLPPRNKEIKMGHKLWNTCACESPRPYVPPTYAECAIQLNLDDICGSEASQTGEEKTYTGHVLDIDHITMCECQLRMRKTQKHNFDMQVHPEDICPSNNVQTGSSLLLLEPIIKRSTEAANTSEKIGHAFKFDNSDSEQPRKFPESEIVETCEVEIQVAATDINPSIDAQPGDSLMLMEPFPPIKPTFSEDEYPEEDATWGDLSINDMISENKSVYAYYKRYEELTKLEKDYEIYARPYTTADQLQQKSMTDSKIDPRNAGNKRSTAFLKPTPSQEYRQYATASYEEPKGTRDHEKGEFRHVAKAKESITVTNYQKESTSDPQARGPFQGKYKNFTSSGINLPSPVGSIESQEGEMKEEEGENQGHRPYRRKRKPNSGPSVETQTFKSMQPNPPPDQPDENPF